MSEVKRRVPPLRFTALEGVLGESGTGGGGVREVRRRVPPLRFTALEGVLGESGTGGGGGGEGG